MCTVFTICLNEITSLLLSLVSCGNSKYRSDELYTSVLSCLILLKLGEKSFCFFSKKSAETPKCLYFADTYYHLRILLRCRNLAVGCEMWLKFLFCYRDYYAHLTEFYSL